MSSNTHITMIDYGASNIRSAYKAFQYLGADIHLTSDPDDVAKATKLTLPGVGAFGSGMAAVRERGLESAIHEAVQRGIPMLGICVGMQFLFDSSDEMGTHTGLGLIPGHVTRFPASNLKVPHMGWNQLIHEGDHPLLAHVPSGSYAYFVHSYHCRPETAELTVAHTDYGINFSAIVAHENVYGLQFHPEKSQTTGLQILQNFIDM